MSEQEQNADLTMALQKFENIMQYRSDMYTRLANRVRNFVRGGMAIVSMVALALFFLLYTLATQMQHAAESTRQIQANVTHVAESMVVMRKLVDQLDQRVALMQDIQNNMSGITQNTQGMVNNVNALNTEMHQVKQRMDNINQSLSRVTHSVSGIGHSVNRVGRDMNGMTGMFPMP